MQDASKNIDVDIMTNDEKANVKCKSSNFRGRQILDPNTVAIATTPPTVSRHMAFAVGFSILEFSKLEMYQVSKLVTFLPEVHRFFFTFYVFSGMVRQNLPKLSRIRISYQRYR